MHTRTLFWASLSIWVGLLAVIGLEYLGVVLTPLRIILSLPALLFIPGLLILRLLRLGNTTFFKEVLYAVGISLAYTMFLGAVANILLPFIGVLKPLSPIPVIITFSVCTLALTGAVYRLDTTSKQSLRWTDFTWLLRPTSLLAIILPFIAMSAAALVNTQKNNILVLLLLAVVAVIIIVIGSKRKELEPKTYCLFLMCIALALLYHRSLISEYLIGSDVHLEYYTFLVTKNNGYWDSSIENSVNAMLSTTILPVVFSHFSKIEAIWIFKFVNPFIFSLLVVILYEIFRKQVGNKGAFLSVLLFISFYSFFTNMLDLNRQMIGEVLIGCSLLLIVDEEITQTKKTLLLLFFVCAIVVSHYTLMYLFAFLILIALIYLRLRKQVSNSVITLTGFLLIVVVTFAWNTYLANAHLSRQFAGSMSVMVFNFFTEFFSSTSREALVMEGAGFGSTGVLSRDIGRYVQLITQGLMVVGFLAVFFSFQKKWKTINNFVSSRIDTHIDARREYFAFSVGGMVLMAIAIIAPFFSIMISVVRIYHIALMFIAPYLIIGIQFIWNTAIDWLKKVNFSPFKIMTQKATQLSYVLLSFLLAIYFLFQCGFVGELFGEEMTSQSLSVDAYRHLITTEQDVKAGEWIKASINPNALEAIYADYFGAHMLWSRDYVDYYKTRGFLPIANKPGQIAKPREDSYVFINSADTSRGKLWIRDAHLRIDADIPLEVIIQATEKKGEYIGHLYDNGRAKVYR